MLNHVSKRKLEITDIVEEFYKQGIKCNKEDFLFLLDGIEIET